MPGVQRPLSLLALVSLLCLASGCSCGWGCGAGALEVGGDHPYRRCLMDDAPEDGERRIGPLGVKIDRRTLAIDLDSDAVRISIVADLPAEAAALEVMARGLEELSVEIVIVLGGLGDDEPGVTRALAALTALDIPVLILGGGADDAELLEEGLDALEEEDAEKVVNIRGIRRIELLEHVFIPVAGAPEGRYARGEGHCGFGAADLADVADYLGDPVEGERRWLLSWAAPVGDGPRSPSLGYGDVEAGSPALRVLAEEVGAEGGVHAWPRARALLPTDATGALLLPVGAPSPSLRIVVPPLAGPPAQRADGSRVASQALVFVLGSEGMALVDAYRASAD